MKLGVSGIPHRTVIQCFQSSYDCNARINDSLLHFILTVQGDGGGIEAQAPFWIALRLKLAVDRVQGGSQLDVPDIGGPLAKPNRDRLPAGLKDSDDRLDVGAS